MAKKLITKALSVGLSLAMCAGMVGPSFAAVAFDKDTHVGKDGSLQGYQDPDNSDVLRYDYYLVDDIILDKTLIVKDGVNASIDLNGKELTGSGTGSVIKVQGDETHFTLDDKVGAGTITGGNAMYGGGVNVDNGGTFAMNNGTISKNTATQGGGVYVGKGGSFEMKGGTIEDNTANSQGGGVSVFGDCTVDNGKILGNEAASGGGIALNPGSSFSMTDSLVDGNNALNGSGGGISINNKGAEISISGSTISNNHAEHPESWGGFGGGIDAANGILSVTNSKITGNTANSGGGMRTGENVTIQNTEISDNNVKYNGAGIYNGGNLTMESGTISGNTAGKLGGGVFNPGHFEMNGGSITGNKAESGGGIYDQYVEPWTKGELEVSANAEIHDNSATTAGDDIYADQGATLKLGSSSWRIDNEDERNANRAYEFAEGEKAVEAIGLKAGTVVPSTAGPDTDDDTTITDATVPMGEDSGEDDPIVEVDDPIIPLAAGPVTRAQFVDYLWRHEGSPEAAAPTFTDVPADHEFAPAIGWVQANDIVSGETFRPDELVTVADVRAILDSFAQVFGTNAVDAADLTTLTVDDGEAMMNCGQVLAEFFGEEYELPEDLDSLETDDAA